jgi:hypothetical protein
VPGLCAAGGGVFRRFRGIAWRLLCYVLSAFRKCLSLFESAKRLVLCAKRLSFFENDFRKRPLARARLRRARRPMPCKAGRRQPPDTAGAFRAL